MEITQYVPVRGSILSADPVYGQCCQQQISLSTESGIVNFMVSPDTYIPGQTHLHTGMKVVGFYDAFRPVILIYPPQYQAALIAPVKPQENVTLDFFDRNLTGTYHPLKLNLSSETQIKTGNGQDYGCPLSNKLLLVYYSFTTRSIPPQTTPSRIIVMC